MYFNGSEFWKRLKKVSGVTKQKDIASVLHITENAISRWINKDQVPSIDHLIRLAEIYNCSIDYLLGIEEQKQKSFEKVIKDLILYDYYNSLNVTEYMEQKSHKEYFSYNDKDTDIYKIAFTDNTITFYDHEKSIKELFNRYEAQKPALFQIEQKLALALIDQIIKEHFSNFPEVEYY